MDKKYQIALFLSISILFAFSACKNEQQGMKQDPGGNSTADSVYHMEENAITEPTPATGPASAYDETNITLPDEASFPIDFEYEFAYGSTDLRLLKTGKLIYSITDANLIDHISDVPNPDSGFFEASAVFNGNENAGDSFTLFYPDFVNEDGSFLQGTYLVMLDVTVTSDGAANYTKGDLDEYGKPMGLYDDPYLFRADGIFYLQDGRAQTVYQDGVAYQYVPSWYIDYFSERNKRTENHMVFRLMPGESISYKIGFLVTDVKEHGLMDLDTLYITVAPGAGPDALIAKLKLPRGESRAKYSD